MEFFLLLHGDMQYVFIYGYFIENYYIKERNY